MAENCTRKIGPFDCCSVVHGDCLELMKQLPDGYIDAVITDPPYGISLADNSAGGRYGRPRRAWQMEIKGDQNQDAGEAILEWANQRDICTVAFSSPKLPWSGNWSSLLVWDKGPAVGGGGDVSRCWKQTWEMIQVRNALLRISRDSAVLPYWVTPELSAEHPAQKPISLMEYLIGRVTDTRQTVLDPFLGSGTTAVAAKKLGRHFLGFEISEVYCQIARERLARIDAQPNLFQPKAEQMQLVSA